MFQLYSFDFSFVWKRSIEVECHELLDESFETGGKTINLIELNRFVSINEMGEEKMNKKELQRECRYLYH